MTLEAQATKSASQTYNLESTTPEGTVDIGYLANKIRRDIQKQTIVLFCMNVISVGFVVTVLHFFP